MEEKNWFSNTIGLILPIKAKMNKTFELNGRDKFQK